MSAISISTLSSTSKSSIILFQTWFDAAKMQSSADSICAVPVDELDNLDWADYYANLNEKKTNLRKPSRFIKAKEDIYVRKGRS